MHGPRRSVALPESEGRSNARTWWVCRAMRCWSARRVDWVGDTRPGLKSLLWAIDNARVDTVVVSRLDRLARNLRGGLELLARLADRGIRVVSVSEGIQFDNSTGRPIASILLGVASYERETTGERIRAGAVAARASAKHVGRPRNEKRLQQVRRMRDENLTVIRIAEKLGRFRQAVYQALAKSR